ncbi:hypothetical protein TNCV_2060231 [Trichonephila clavipes]|nr:hypothetical protein TNCV_2060231 [Trichonephila clavipes]
MLIVVLAAFVVLGENIDNYKPVGAENVEFAFIPSNLLLMLKLLKLNLKNLVGSVMHEGRSLLAWKHNSASELGNLVFFWWYSQS